MLPGQAQTEGRRMAINAHIQGIAADLLKQAEPIARIVKEEMEGVAQLKVPLVVDAGWGPSWYEAKA
jgi:DNA polymerase-1